MIVALLTALVLLGCQSDRSASGVLVGVEAAGFARVEAFTLRTDEGQRIRFRVAADAEQGEHPPSPSHLRQHMTYGDRLTVRYRETSEGPLAVELIDQQ